MECGEADIDPIRGDQNLILSIIADSGESSPFIASPSVAPANSTRRITIRMTTQLDADDDAGGSASLSASC